MPQRIRGKIQPRGSLVVVRKHETKDNVTEGGVLIPGAVANKGVAFATVMAVGPGRIIDSGAHVEMDLKPGDTVLMQVTPDVMPLSIEDRDIFLINERGIVARIIEQENENE